MDDLLREFLTETNEGLAMLDQGLVELEQRPNDKNLLSSIFRIVHTIKGTCGFIGLPRLEKVAHAAENVLGMFRDGKLNVTPGAVTLILNSIDQIKYLLAEIEMNHTEPVGEDSALIERLNRWAAGEGEGATRADTVSVAINVAPHDKSGMIDAAADTVQVELSPQSVELDVPQVSTSFAAAPPPAPVVPPAAPVEAPAAAVADAKAPTAGTSIADQSIRVGVDVLENLMNTVSELVLTRNQLLQLLRAQKDQGGENGFAASLQRLNLVTSELQEGVMKTRMQPIGNAWQKLPRIVRDLAMELGKKIDLVMIGQETELDRQVLELIKDPLTHMVRNSADHGLEMPADRLLAGKPEMGKVTLSAFHEGGHIIIQIADDGKGLPVELIKKKAIANGLATEAELAAMPEQQIFQFIFKAGFSTAAAVTSVSGRGVGMDVVRTNIEKIGGTIELTSKVGKGSTFTIKIPLTLAIVSALIVEAGGERYAIPQLAVTELVRARPNSDLAIERLNDTPVLRLRNRLLPLVSLKRTLKLGDGQNEESTFVVVTQVGQSHFGIMVDRVFDTEEIVVKPVAPLLRDIGLFSGNTILGDGSVIMILDPNGIAVTAGENIAAASDAANEQALAVRTSQDTMALLLFRARGGAGGDKTGAPKAVPLSLIARLEEIDLSKVEYAGGVPMIQYREHLMPLIPIDGAPGKPVTLPQTGNQPVLVFSDKDHTMGLLVDEILDIVEERLSVELGSEQPGLMGSAIIAGQATDVIDAGHYLTLAFRDWFNVEADGTFEESTANRILLVDDSPFFRNLLAPLLTVAGYQVSAVESPLAAIKLAESGETFDLIVSDIEMPEMSGFEFAQLVRDGQRGTGVWQGVPMIALSSHATARDLERGREVGFTDYVAKFDREALLQSIHRLMRHAGAARETMAALPAAEGVH